ncbi:MAG: hydrogenase expression/formation protein HypE [Deltaproteobacteria bacterium]|nr:hydrogenase expression/formation protein HypE [Deltaproteobacteria bacterium]
MSPTVAACPVPSTPTATVLLAHGGGGRLTHKLVDELFLPAFANPLLTPLHDGAVLDLGSARLAFSTDSFVVKPLFFPGGDIGSLAVYGTVNDLAMCGARPLALSAGYILEEGLGLETLTRVVASMAAAARRAGVAIVTGDTKVVDRGKGDQIFINTAGVGLIPPQVEIAPRRATVGDVILLSGDIARHGVTILSQREGLAFETTLESDAAPLADLVATLVATEPSALHVLRDPTRGGVATALCEIAAAAQVGVQIDERAVVVRDPVRGACEMLGLDPLYVANEGKLLAVVARDAADRLLEAMRKHPDGAEAARIGEIVAEHRGKVVMNSQIGARRVVEMMSGEQLPRIC